MEQLSLTEVDIQPSVDNCYTLESANIVDERNRVVQVTLISVGPGNTRDKNFYSQEAINSGAPLFEGSKCFANHPSAIDAKVQPERRVQDIIGYFSEVKAEGEKLNAKLNITPGENAEWSWPLIKQSIEYAKKYPGKVLAGLSINARGGQEPFEFQGEQWKKVTQFLEVRSVDLVTVPARGGKVEQVLSESEAVGSSACNIFTAIKETVKKLNDESYPGMEDLRRQLDQLGTELKFNQAEEGEKMADKKNDSVDFDQMADSYKKMSEDTKDPVMKAMHGTASETFKSMGKAKASESEAKKKEDEAKKEAESKAKQSEKKKESEDEDEDESEAKKKKEAEAKKKEAEAKKESEFQTKYINLKKETLLTEAGLSEAHKDFVGMLLEGKTDEDEIATIVKKYAAVQLQEGAKRQPHNFQKLNTQKSETKKSAADKLDAVLN